MEIIINNPFRILGLFANAKTAMVNRNFNRLKMYAGADQEIPDELSLAVFPSLGPCKRTPDNIDYASAHLNLDQDKMLAALLWFYDGNDITDEPAFAELSDANIQGASNIWIKLVEKGEINERNFSAFQNISTLYLLRAFKGSFSDIDLLTSAIKWKIQFLESDFALKYKADITDTTYKISKDDLQLLFLHEIEQEIQKSKKYKDSVLIGILGGIDFAAKAEFLNRFVQKPIEKIEKNLEEAKRKRKSNKSDALNAGDELYSNTSKELEQVKEILGISDLKYTTIADKVANEILQCSIEYFNHNKEVLSIDDYFEQVLELFKFAEAISTSKITKDRIQDSLKKLDEMKEREILQAIEALQSVKNLYDSNEQKILQEVGHMLFQNRDKIDKIIHNSLNWDKVIEFILEVIPPKNIDKIKNVSNQETLDKYTSLVTFLISKLNYVQKRKVRYLSYWESQTMFSIPTWADIEKLPTDIKWILGSCLFLLIVFIVFGESGISFIFSIATIVGISWGINWLRYKLN